jgi:hypothetical protein
MDQERPLVRSELTTPRAAAVAGILFSVLLIISLAIIRFSIPADPHDAGQWLGGDIRPIDLALTLLPFAGIAFLWFIGVVRDRLGEYEDRLFATVFLGSGLLFLALLFSSAALAGGILIAYGGSPAAGAAPTALISSETYVFARAVTFVILNTYAIKMAGVFMIATGTLFIRTRVTPRWMALLGYALALLLLVSISRVSWIFLVFPLWILLISIYILIENFRRGPDTAMSGPDPTASGPDAALSVPLKQEDLR